MPAELTPAEVDDRFGVIAALWNTPFAVAEPRRPRDPDPDPCWCTVYVAVHDWQPRVCGQPVRYSRRSLWQRLRGSQAAHDALRYGALATALIALTHTRHGDAK